MKIKRLLKKQGFTLVEMIVVVAIIGILLGIVIPMFNTNDAIIRAAKEKARAFYSNVQELMVDEKLAGTKLPGENAGDINIIYVKLEIPSDSTVCDADIYMLKKTAGVTGTNILSSPIAECRSALDINDSENRYSAPKDSSDTNPLLSTPQAWNSKNEWKEFAYSLYKILRISDIDGNYADSGKQTAYFYAEVDNKYRVVTAYYSLGDAEKAVGKSFDRECYVKPDSGDLILTGAYPYDKCASGKTMLG